MVFAEAGDVVSGGNFHGAPIAVAADVLAIALAQFATISERRTDRLVNPASSGLAPFLAPHPGLQSGFMLAQVTAAALASELKGLAHPASVDTIPTSAGREDHVSMSMGAALKAQAAVELAVRVVAIELLAAAQAIDLLAPLQTSEPLRRVHARIRSDAPHLDTDRSLASDIERIATAVASGAFRNTCAREVK
jgi:histidine ammonia-lyase